MKKLNVTVNGTTYQVEVEEVGGPASSKATAAALSAQASAPSVIPSAVSAQRASSAQVAAGDTSITAPMPGKVTKVVAKVGDQVKKGDVIAILEAMKMQNEIGALSDGTVKSIYVDAGQSVKSGEVMAVIG